MCDCAIALRIDAEGIIAGCVGGTARAGGADVIGDILILWAVGDLTSGACPLRIVSRRPCGARGARDTSSKALIHILVLSTIVDPQVAFLYFVTAGNVVLAEIEDVTLGAVARIANGTSSFSLADARVGRAAHRAARRLTQPTLAALSDAIQGYVR